MQQISGIKKRIRSITKIKQMTRATQLISAIKSRKSKQLLDQAFPFMVTCAETMTMLLKQTDLPDNPLLAIKHRPDDRRRKLVFYVFTGDQGLAGAYNLNVLTTAEAFIEEKIAEFEAQGLEVEHSARIVGSIGLEHMQARGIHIVEPEIYPVAPPTYYRAGELSLRIEDLYLSHEVDEIYFIFTRMNRALSMEVIKTRVLPADIKSLETIYEGYTTLQWEEVPDGRHIDFGENVERVFSYLIDTYLNGMTYGAMVEAHACEQAARMMAMDSANRSADEMLAKLEIERNRARQASITNELNEIVSGAETLSQQRK